MNGDCTISVRTLGTFRIAFDGDPVERWHAGKARKLLQFFLLHRDRMVSREALYDALWSESSRSANSSALKVAVHALRSVLREAQLVDRSGHMKSSLEVLTCESGYKLETRNVWTDFNEYGALVDRAYEAQSRGHLDLADGLYRQAVDLYEGDFLPNLPDDWATTYREWMRSRQLLALGYLSSRRRECGDHLKVIDLCHRMLSIDPLHESPYRMLISVHAELGQFGQVQRWYNVCAKRLHDELQLPPDEETQRAFEHAFARKSSARC